MFSNPETEPPKIPTSHELPRNALKLTNPSSPLFNNPSPTFTQYQRTNPNRYGKLRAHTDMSSAPAKNVNSLITFILDEPPSCIEFWPADPSYFVVGTYVLEDEGERDGEEQVRSGSLVLMRLADGEIRPLHTLALPHAVLDLHFCLYHIFFFAVATSTGSISLYSLNPGSESPITHISTSEICETSVLVLSLAWRPDRSKGWEVAVSLSNGQIAVTDLEGKDTAIVKSETHNAEAWCVAWDGAKLWSGGDDSVIASSELQEAKSREDELDHFDDLSVNSDRRIHDAGVTAILPIELRNKANGMVMVTGSYDEFIRVLEPPAQGGRFRVLAEKRLDGGVWRLKLLDAVNANAKGGIKFKILASCMHAGAKLVEICWSVGVGWNIKILVVFEEHQSMNYGCDVHAIVAENGKRTWTCVSTSFYDKKLCVWKFEDD